MQEGFTAILMVIGAMFMFVAGLGVLRMPDLFIRMSAATKASTLGVGFLLCAVVVKFTYLEIISRTFAIIIFVILTAPVGAHMIGRAAYVVGVPLWKGTIIDQLCGKYDRCSDVSESRSEGNSE